MTKREAQAALKAASKELAIATEVQAQALAQWVSAYNDLQAVQRLKG